MGPGDNPNVKRLVDDVSRRPAALRVGRLKATLKLKTEFDDEDPAGFVSAK